MKTVSFGVLLRDLVKGTGTYSGELNGLYSVIWTKKEGDFVAEGETIASIEVDKILLEVIAPICGRLVSLFQESEWSTNGELGEAFGGEKMFLPAFGAVEAEGVVSPTPFAQAQSGVPVIATSTEIASITPLKHESGDSRANATPLARRMAKDAGVDVSSLQGTGIGGRVRAADVESSLDEKVSVRAVPAARALAREKGIDLASIRGSGSDRLVLLEDARQHLKDPSVRDVAQTSASREPVQKEDHVVVSASFMRKSIARLLEKSWREVPHAGDRTLPVDVTDLVLFHKRYAPLWRAPSGGVKLRYDTYLVYLAVQLLKEPRFAILNGWWDEKTQSKVLNPHVNMGIVVTVPDKKDPQDEHLLIPVIHRAEEMDFPALAEEAHTLIENALLGKLAIADMRGLTVTFNNTGVLGGTSPDSILPYVIETDGTEHPSGFIFNLTSFEKGSDGWKTYAHIAFRFDHRLCLSGSIPSAFANELKRKIEAPQTPDDFLRVFGLA